MKLTSVLLAGFIVLTIALAFKTYQLGQQHVEGLRVASRDVREAEEINRGLLDRIHTLRAPPFSLVGMEVMTGRKVTVEPVDSMVLYLFGTDCPYSPDNVPFLNELHAAGVNVVGVAPEETRPQIEMFARISGTAFPLLVHPTGEVVEVLPLDPVPMTAVFLGGRVETL
jgi:hypothetical protein